jgi:hypothetical protein
MVCISRLTMNNPPNRKGNKSARRAATSIELSTAALDRLADFIALLERSFEKVSRPLLLASFIRLLDALSSVSIDELLIAYRRFLKEEAQGERSSGNRRVITFTIPEDLHQSLYLTMERLQQQTGQATKRPEIIEAIIWLHDQIPDDLMLSERLKRLVRTYQQDSPFGEELTRFPVALSPHEDQSANSN